MRELVIDSFAGGGGASTGIAAAIGRDPDHAINHDAEALAMTNARTSQRICSKCGQGRAARNRCWCRECLNRQERERHRLWKFRNSVSWKGRWSAGDTARFLTMEALGLPDDIIAVWLDRSAGAIRSYRYDLADTSFARFLRLPVDRRWPEERIALLRRMLRVEGLSYGQAAKRLGLSRSAISGAVHRYLPEGRRLSTQQPSLGGRRAA